MSTKQVFECSTKELKNERSEISVEVVDLEHRRETVTKQIDKLNMFIREINAELEKRSCANEEEEIIKKYNRYSMDIDTIDAWRRFYSKAYGLDKDNWLKICQEIEGDKS